MSNRYSVHINFSYEFDTPKDINDAQLEVENYLNKITPHIVLTKKQIRLDKIKRTRQQICLGEFRIDEVLPYVSKKQRKREYNTNGSTYQVRMDSSRYFVFRENIKCSACGLEGTKFCLEKNLGDTAPHFNLYAVENNRNILMTKDHIYPKSIGGGETHSNFQTMCTICNNLKGSSNITLEKIKELRVIYNSHKNLPKKKFNKILEDARALIVKPHGKPHITRSDRKAFLTSLKVNSDSVVTNADLRIWKLENGSLVCQSLYDLDVENATEYASIRIGTVFNIVQKLDDRVIIKLNNDMTCEINNSYIEYLTPIEKDLIQANIES